LRADALVAAWGAPLSIKNGCGLGLAVIAISALGAAPAAAQFYASGYYGPRYFAFGYHAARYHHKGERKPDREETERVGKEPFGDIPKGPLQVFISINQQKLHLYSNGVHVADTSIATGVPSLPTPLGVFSVIQKQIFHRSNIYSNAPMPFMQRITWSGVAMHEGENIGHPASHGCIRMPHDFAVRLYRLTRLGVPVIVARPELKPVEFADPHLFVHRDRPPQQIAAAPGASPSGQAAPPAAGVPAQPAALGLRTNNDAATASAGGTATADDAPKSAPPATREAPAKKTPIAIFISRKAQKIYVRQDFEPLFDAAVTIAEPNKPLGTHVFTALAFAGEDHTALRWNAVSLPGEPPPKPAPHAQSERRYGKHARGGRRGEDNEKSAGEPPPPQTPAEALARIDIPQAAIDRISQLIVPGSSLIVSDQGLGDETGDGTNFIVVTR
jgi:lipoprotein-anchoring transpeptidase ErfK/SrfK